MVTMFGRQQTTEGGLDARIRRLSEGRERVENPQTTPPPTAAPHPDGPNLERPTAPAPAAAPLSLVDPAAPGAAIEERLAIAREELSARLGAEIRPERRAMLTRGDLAKIVDAAVQAYFVRHAMDANP